MKVLVDPVHTNDPQYCSANYKMQTLMRWVLEQRSDVFFYYLLPDPERSVGRWAIDHDWLLQHPNVRYLPVAGDPDRMREYSRVGPDLEDVLAFNGSNWDWDIVLTGRSTQVATYRMWMTRAKRHWMRMALIEDEFPIMSFKKRVSQPCPEASDLQSISGYVAADRTYVFSMASRGLILAEARKWLAPSRVRDLEQKLVTAISRTFDEVRCKPDAAVRATAERQKPLTVAYTQRLSGKVDRQDDVLETFFRHYALHGGQDRLRLLLTSNSRVVDRYEIPRFSHLEVQRAPRDEFWRLMREEVDLILAMSPDEDYPLSLIEPVALGVPLIVLDAAYVRPTFGKDYPFIVKGAGEAYAMMREFVRDYAGCYERFRQWSQAWFQPEMQHRNGLWFGHLFMADLERHEAFLRQRWAGSENQIVAAIEAWAARHDRRDLTLEEALHGLDQEKVLRNLHAIFRKSRHALAHSMAPNFNEYRQILVYGRGWRDASTSVGHLAR